MVFRRPKGIIRGLLSLLLPLIAAQIAYADAGTVPRGERGPQLAETSSSSRDAVLVVTDASGVRHDLTLQDLRDMPAVTFKATDPWEKKEYAYTGVPLVKLLRELGVQSGTWIDVIARNDYAISISWPDAERISHLLAYELDGMAIHDHPDGGNKAPLVIAIEFREDINQEIYKHHLVWMVKAINVR